MHATLPQAGSPRDPARRRFVPGPEATGVLLSLAVLVVAGVLLAPGLLGSGTTPIASPLPSAGVVDPTAVPASQPPATAPWARDAATLLDVDERLLALRDTLVEQADPRPSRADELARTMRNINSQLAFALATIGRLEAAGMPATLVDSLREAHQAALDESVATLRASQSNVEAYLAGAEAIVVELTRVEALQAALAEQSGEAAPAP